MAHSSKKQQPRTIHQHIDDLKDLVRLGLPPSTPDSLTDKAAARKLKKEIQRELDVLAPRVASKNAAVSPEYMLTYRTLLAEIEFGLGRGETRAAEALRQYVNALDLPGQLAKWTMDKKVPQRTDGISVRQKIWALMGVAFYSDFAGGEVKKALHLLGRIRQFIDPALSPGGQGTRARCHELQAQLYRTLGEHTAAELEAIESQRFIERRLRRELLKHSDNYSKRDEAYRLSAIGTARILGGLGRVAILQGQLRRAQMSLRSARTLLRPTGQAALKLVVASHLAITRRRSAEPDAGRDTEWADAMTQLRQLHECSTRSGVGVGWENACNNTFQAIDSPCGSSRCLPDGDPVGGGAGLLGSGRLR